MGKFVFFISFNMFEILIYIRCFLWFLFAFYAPSFLAKSPLSTDWSKNVYCCYIIYTVADYTTKRTGMVHWNPANRYCPSPEIRTLRYLVLYSTVTTVNLQITYLATRWKTWQPFKSTQLSEQSTRSTKASVLVYISS